MKTKIFTVALTLALFSKAQAGFLVEPYLGYQAATVDIELGAAAAPFNGQKITMGASGNQFGLRLGYELPVVSIAADYASAKLSNTVKSQPAGFAIPSSDSTRTSLGLTVAANLLLIKPYVGYIFDDKSKDDTSTTSGNGFKVGLGFSIIPKLKLNLEYQMMTYTKIESAGTTTTFSSSESIKSEKATGYGINLSVPFSF